MKPQELAHKAIQPLGLIFWGSLLCTFDFHFGQTVNGEGFRFDILNDAVGAGLVTVGIFILASFPVSTLYSRLMPFVQIGAILGVVDGIYDHFVTRQPMLPAVVLQILATYKLAALGMFCVVMQEFCQAANLFRSERSWHTTLWLLVWLYFLPFGLLLVAGSLSGSPGRRFHFDLGPAGLLVLAVFAIPSIHLFVSIWRTGQEVQDIRPDKPNEASYR